MKREVIQDWDEIIGIPLKKKPWSSPRNQGRISSWVGNIMSELGAQMRFCLTGKIKELRSGWGECSSCSQVNIYIKNNIIQKRREIYIHMISRYVCEWVQVWCATRFSWNWKVSSPKERSVAGREMNHGLSLRHNLAEESKKRKRLSFPFIQLYTMSPSKH